MKVSSKVEEHSSIVCVEEERIDAAVALAFKDAMRKATENAEKRIVLDLHNVTFVDSSGLGAIVATLKHVTPERKLVLAGLTPAVKKVFTLTRMDTVFRLFETLDDAMRGSNA